MFPFEVGLAWFDWFVHSQHTRRLEQGLVALESRRGTSSHQHNPFAVVTHGPPRETEGQCYAVNLGTTIACVL